MSRDKSQEKDDFRRRIRIRTVIGVVMGLILLISVYVLMGPGVDPIMLTERYLVPYPNLVAPRQSEGLTVDSTYASAFQLYEIGYYEKADDQFGRLDETDEAVQFYSALTALLDNQPEEAITRFEGIVSDSKHAYFAAALWYCALAHLRLGERREARAMLIQIEKAESEFARSASDLLAEM